MKATIRGTTDSKYCTDEPQGMSPVWYIDSRTATARLTTQNMSFGLPFNTRKNNMTASPVALYLAIVTVKAHWLVRWRRTERQRR
jgi:hypothetical protein